MTARPEPEVSSVSVVIPVYNSQRTLQDLVQRLEPVLQQVTDRYELILVDDGSRDDSWATIERVARDREWVVGIQLMRNYGQHNALLCGIRHAQNEIIVTMDDDLQNPPEEIPKMLARLGHGVDVVYGTPDKEAHGLWRNLASRLIKLALRRTIGAQAARHVSAFRAFRTPLRDAFADYRGPFVSIDVLLTWTTTRFAAVRVRHDERRVGVSNYTVAKLVLHALNMLTGFSTWPLRLASLAGFGFTIVGVAVLLYVVGRYFLRGGSVAGFPFLASIIAIFAGAQLFALGVIGEYLARLHFRTMERPPYFVRSSTSGD